MTKSERLRVKDRGRNLQDKIRRGLCREVWEARCMTNPNFRHPKKFTWSYYAHKFRMAKLARGLLS